MSAFELKGFQVEVPTLEVACDDVRVESGEWLIIKAPSGFGKSSLFRGILGLEKVRGEVLLGGRRMDSLPVDRRNFGVVFQEQLLFAHLNAFENALFGVALRRKPNAADLMRMEEGFQILGLSHRRKAALQELSGGERQRIAILRALAFDPDLLLLDEPFRGLDAGMVQKARGWIEGFLSRKAVPVIWITHQQEFEVGRKKELVGGEWIHGRRHFKYDSCQSEANQSHLG